jgi:hypothetical protein
VTIPIPAITQIIKDFKANMRQWQDAADIGGQKTSGFTHVLESATMVWEKLIVGIDRGKIAMNALAAMNDKLKASMRGIVGVAGEASAKMDFVTKKTKSWNEELGVTTRLEMEKHITLMEQALAKYADKLPISEQARLKEEIAKAKDELNGFNFAAQESLGILPNLRNNINNLIVSLDIWLSTLPSLRQKTTDLFITWDEYSKKAASSIKALADDTVSSGQQISSTIANMIGAVSGAIGQNLSAAQQKFLSLVQSMILGAVQICVALRTIKAATGDIIGAVVALGSAIFAALFGGKAKKTTAERLAEELVQTTKNVQLALSSLGKVSESTAKIIAEDMQKGMEGYVAVSKNFASVIQDVGVNQQNVNELWSRAGWIIDEMTSGMLSATDGAKSLGESFKLLVDGAKKLGQEGSLAMVEFIKKIRQSGLEVAEITEYVLGQLDKIPSALASIVKNIFMPPTYKNVLENMVVTLQGRIDKFKNHIKDLVNEISKVKKGTPEWKRLNDEILKTRDRLTNAENALKDTNGELRAIEKNTPKARRELEAMGHIAAASFQAMLANGRNFLDALEAMKEPLHELLVRYKAFGLEIPKFLHPLMRMEWLAEKFPAAFENMSSALDILNSLRNSAYLTQDTFNSLLTVVNQFARTILNTSGNLNTFMKTARLTQTQIQTLLPIISQFVGAAAIFGLGVPSWMRTFVTEQLGVDWGQFRDLAMAQANSGINTVEKLKALVEKSKTMLERLHVYDTRMRDRFLNLRNDIKRKLDGVINAINGLPGQMSQSTSTPTPPGLQHGGIVYAPRTVTVGEVPEVIIPLDKISELLKTGIRVEIQPVVIPKGDKYVIEFLQKSIERGNIRIPITAVG